MTPYFYLPGAAAAVLLALPAGADGLSHLPRLADIAPDAIAISPHVPHMGEHWANPADLPLGPIYCVIDGRVVCVEYMFLSEDLSVGTDWTEISTGFATPPVTRIDMQFKADGVGPMPVPLYQLHVYFAEDGVLAAY